MGGRPDGGGRLEGPDAGPGAAAEASAVGQGLPQHCSEATTRTVPVLQCDTDRRAAAAVLCSARLQHEIRARFCRCCSATFKRHRRLEVVAAAAAAEAEAV